MSSAVKFQGRSVQQRATLKRCKVDTVLPRIVMIHWPTFPSNNNVSSHRVKKTFFSGPWGQLYVKCVTLRYIKSPLLVFAHSHLSFFIALFLSLSPALDFTPTLSLFLFVRPSIYAPLFGPIAIRLQCFPPPLVQADNSTRDLFATQLSG